MTELLVPYIPFSCSLVFQPREEDRAPTLAIHPSFTPAWFRQHMALDYQRPWHTDPRLRHASFVEMAAVLNRRFPRLRLGGDPHALIGSISQVHTCAVMAALFGQEIIYEDHTWPANRGEPLSDQQADRLKVPDVEGHPLFADLMRQMDVIESEWGLIEGELNYQGVLNTAFRLRGQQIFLDMLDEPERAHHVLTVVWQTMVRFVDAVYARQKRSGARRDYFVTANCVVNMLGAEQYRQFVLPYDGKLAQHFPCFGIHNCAWNVDPYAQDYASIGPLAYLDFGLQSDLARLKRLFPGTTLCPMYSPVDLARKPLEAIGQDLQRLHDQIGACRIIVADIEAGTPDARLMEFFQMASKIWGIALEELAPAPKRW